MVSVLLLFGELQLIPQSVLGNKGKRLATEEALCITFNNLLHYFASLGGKEKLPQWQYQISNWTSSSIYSCNLCPDSSLTFRCTSLIARKL
jgi:hypothetical protein